MTAILPDLTDPDLGDVLVAFYATVATDEPPKDAAYRIAVSMQLRLRIGPPAGFMPLPPAVR